MASSNNQLMCYKSEITLKQMQIFTAVAESLSFSKAARLLFVTQPLVSQQISEIERIVGEKLVERNRHSVRLTDRGEALRREVNDILCQLNDTVKKIGSSDLRNCENIHFNVCFEQMFSRTAITKTIVAHKIKYPNVKCHISQSNINDIYSKLNERDLSVGFILIPDDQTGKNLMVEVLESDVLCIAVAAPLATSGTLAHYTKLMESIPVCLIENDTRGLNATLRVCHELRVAPQFVFFPSASEIIMHVETGEGVTVLPSSILPNTNTLSYKTLDGFEEAKVKLAACWNKDYDSPIINTFLDIYREERHLFRNS